MQTSHGPQSLKQLRTGVHGLQRAVFATSASVQVPSPAELVEPSQTNSPPAAAGRPRIAGKVQQPKQSHPFGVMGRQVLMHIAGCVLGQVIPPTKLRSYGHVGPSGGKSGATDSGSHR
jgi:hypothetical protein